MWQGANMEQVKPLIRLRPANEEDVNFIFNSWLKSFRNSAFARHIPNSIYYTEQHKLIEKLVKNFSVIIACNDEDASQVYGWICAGEVQNIFCLHYIYVKHSFRSMGIAKLLFNSFKHDPSTAGIYTHHCRIADTMASKTNMIYDPYILTNDYIKEVKNG
jgi:hypothetical protein